MPCPKDQNPCPDASSLPRSGRSAWRIVFSLGRDDCHVLRPYTRRLPRAQPQNLLLGSPLHTTIPTCPVPIKTGRPLTAALRRNNCILCGLDQAQGQNLVGLQVKAEAAALAFELGFVFFQQVGAPGVGQRESRRQAVTLPRLRWVSYRRTMMPRPSSACLTVSMTTLGRSQAEERRQPGGCDGGLF